MKSSAYWLNQFALAVDTIEDSVCDDLRQLMTKYFRDRAGAFHFEILMDGIGIEDGDKRLPGLSTRWSQGAPRTMSIYKNDGQSYRGQCAFAYHQTKNLWVSDAEGRPLGDPEARPVDHWSGVEDLPPYVPVAGEAARTSILLPLRYGGRVFGVACLEFVRLLPCTSHARLEVELMADALARIVWLHHTTKTQLDDTRRALDELEQNLINAPSIFDKPSIFFAASSRADTAVVAAIKEVLEQKADGRLELIAWDELNEAGPINPQIVNAISHARYGVCYLSEPNDKSNGSALHYSDNRNVLFEAGMFEALAMNGHTTLEGWIPIRENDELAGDAPFDIAGHRMVIVPRVGARKAVDVGALKAKLADTLDDLFRQ